MPTKQQLQTTLTNLQNNIRDTIRLLQEQHPDPDYTLIRQLGWNLGWHPDGTYVDTILDDPYYDHEAITFTTKVLKALLEPTTQIFGTPPNNHH